MKKWSHFPQRFMHNPKFLGLPAEQAALLHRMYMTCDRWGRGPVDPMCLAQKTGLSMGEIEYALPQLIEDGFVQVGAGDGFQLIGYDTAAPRDVTRGRAPSMWSTEAA